MNLTTLRSGQLVHVYGTPPCEFGIYLEQPRAPGQKGRPKRIYFYYHRTGNPRLPGAWRLVPFNSSALWLLAPLRPVIQPQVSGGTYTWRVPHQDGIPDVEIRWEPSEGSGGAGLWSCSVPGARGPAGERDRRPRP